MGQGTVMGSMLFERAFAAGTILFRQGEHGDCAYVLKSGRVAVLDERTEPASILAVLGPGEIIGEMSLLDGQPRSATVRAVDDCHLTVITQEQLSRRLSRADPIVRSLFEIVLNRFRFSEQRRADGAKMRPARVGCGGFGDGSEQAAALSAVLDRERALHQGIERSEFRLFAQPIVCLVTGHVAGFEGLLRWQHPERGLLPPSEFVALMEETDLIVPVGQWIVTEGLAQQALFAEAYRRAHPKAPAPFISVNVSARQFNQGHIHRHLLEALEERGQAATAGPFGPFKGKLKLEITESILIENPEAAGESLRDCRGLGASIAIDDFGTGYASLGYLQRFPIDTIKIDRSFVGNIQADARSRAITRGIIELARGLDMDVVAEGIETAEQSHALHRLGCGLGQGYLFGRPMPPEAAVQLLESWQPDVYCGSP